MPIASRKTPPSFVSKGIRRSQQFRQFKTLPEETTKQFSYVGTSEASAWPWAKDELAAGETVHMIDVETGTAMPWSLSSGYYCYVLMTWINPQNTLRHRMYVDGNLIASRNFNGLQSIYLQMPIALHTRFIDPEAEESHTVDVTITNTSDSSAEVSSKEILVLKKAGTEPLPDKVIYTCSECGNQWEDDIRKTRNKCPKCGYEFRTFSLREV